MRKKNKQINKLGRKPVEPSKKKVLLGFYTEQGNIDEAGGIERARNMAKSSFENLLAAKYYPVLEHKIGE